MDCVIEIRSLKTTFPEISTIETSELSKEIEEVSSTIFSIGFFITLKLVNSELLVDNVPDLISFNAKATLASVKVT